MSLWSSYIVPWIDKRDISTIRVEDMKSIIMQGIDIGDRPFLAMIVNHEGENKVGFIRQYESIGTDLWEYGLLDKMDLCVLVKTESNRYEPIYL